MKNKKPKKVDKPKTCSFCGSTDHELNSCQMFIILISSGC